MPTVPRTSLFLLLLLLIASSSLDAASLILGPAAPVSAIDYAPAGNDSEGAVAVVNGDRALVAWNRAERAARIDQQGKPLDIPAIDLPKPQYTSGVDVVADGDGWLAGWTIFWWKGSASQSALRLARVTREGEIADVREIALPVIVSQNEPLHLATRGGVIVAAYRTTADFSWRSIVATESSHVVFDGELRELTATDDGFAVLLRDRVVRLTADAAPAAVVTLPADFAPTHVARRDGETVIAGGTQNGIAVARWRDATNAVEISRESRHSGTKRASLCGTARSRFSGARPGHIISLTRTPRSISTPCASSTTAASPVRSGCATRSISMAVGSRGRTLRQ